MKQVGSGEAPQWALDEAAKAAGWNCWSATYADARGDKLVQSIRAHALTIARHETPPVDKDLEKARELVREARLCDVNTSTAVPWITITQSDAEQAILAGIKWARSNKGEDNGTF